MKIITVSREFGSGGREVGKRLADRLGIPCYDREIIDMVAEKQGLDKNYVEYMSENDIRLFYPSTIGRSFYAPTLSAPYAIQIAATEHQIIKELSLKSDCVIVGRCADVILKDQNPLRLFVYADEQSKLVRCRNRASNNENLTDKELARKIKEVDQKRAAYRKSYTEHRWGDYRGYDLCINTSGKEIKILLPGLVSYVNGWFYSRLN